MKIKEKGRTALSGALVSLLRKCYYKDITVAEIIKKAKMSKSSFYYYFSSKDQLLAYAVSKRLKERFGESGLADLFSLLSEIEKEKNFYAETFLTSSVAIISSFVKRNIEKSYNTLSPASVSFLSDSFLSYIYRWLWGEEPLSAKEALEKLEKIRSEIFPLIEKIRD